MASEMVSGHTKTENPIPAEVPSINSLTNENVLHKTSRNSSSGEEDGLGNLVIDTDEDIDKINKESKPFYGFQNNSNERKSPVRNNNNNNSVGRSLCNNKHIGNVEKDSSANKSLLSNNGRKISSPSQSTGFTQSGKIVKAKSKKSTKSNKSHVSMSVSSGATSGANSRASSPTAPFIDNALDTDSNSNVDSKMMMPRTSSSPDESNGKKSKSNKSKSHKKHSKHNEKNSSVNFGVNKADSSIEKLKSKSKSTTSSLITAGASSTFSSLTSSHELLTCASTSLSNSGTPEKNESTQYQNATHKFNDLVMSQSAYSHKSSQNALQNRVPARTAVIAGTTGNGAESAHAYSHRDSSESDPPVSQNQHSRKKHKKAQSALSSIQHSSVAPANSDISQSRSYSFHSSSVSSGKRDRASGANSHSTASGNENSKSKKMKLEQENKDNNTRIPLSTVGLSSHPLNQFNSSSLAENAEGIFSGIRSKNLDNSAGNTLQNSGVKAVAPLVFAPSSHFATSIPRCNTSNTNEHLNTFGSSKVEPKQMLSGHFEQKDAALQSNMNSQRTVGTVTCTTDIGVMTEPDALGPCEPGTTVHLDGIVWQETDTGVLVVNVTWRNRTYVGTLLDATKHDWAPPRFSDSDLDIELRGKTSRSKRSRGGQSENNRKGRSRGSVLSTSDDIKSSPSAAAKRRNKNSESEAANNTDYEGTSTPRSSTKRLRLTTSRGTKDNNHQPQNEEAKAESNTGSGSSSCSSPIFLECPHPKCNKRYRDADALKYHQSHAHCDSNEEEEKETNDEETGSDSIKSSDSVCQNAISSDVESIPVAEHKKTEVSKRFRCSKTEADSDPKVNSKSRDFKADFSTSLEVSHPPRPMGKDRTESHPAPSSTCSANPVPLNPPQHTSDDLAEEQVKVSKIPLSSTTSSAPKSHLSVLHNQGASDCSKENHVIGSQTLASSSDYNAADIEKAEAVQFLLKSQHNDESLFPGLSSYSQDSPHPTLTLGSRTLLAPSHESVAPDQRPPSRLHEARYPPAAYNEKKGLTAPASTPHITISQHNHPASSVQTEVLSLPTNAMSRSSSAFTNSYSSIPEKNGPSLISAELSDFSQKTGHGSVLPKDNYTVSVSGNNHSVGLKVAKGKTVPIPVDPNYGFHSNYADSALLSNLNKKMKRRKKPEEKTDDSPESPKPADATSVPVPDQTRTFLASEVPLPPLTDSHGGDVPESTSLHPSYLSLYKNQNPNTLGSESVLSGQTSDTNRRALSQSNTSAGRKFPGIISPVSSSQSNNITVTGTFHPHPDPHKPQTAVSAQAQDRLRALRPLSPTHPSNNKNNNNKFPGSYGGNTGRPSLPFSKPRPSSGLSERIQCEKPSHPEQEALPSRSKGSELKTNQQEFSINRMQNQVESEIENVYSKELATKPKPMSSCPAPSVERVRDSPIPMQRPVERPFNLSDDAKSSPQKNFPRTVDLRPGFEEPHDNRKSTPSPGSKAIAENQRLSYLPVLNPHLMQLGGMGYLPPHLMDPGFSPLPTQYMDPQAREVYARYLQDCHQQVLHHQQQQQQQQQQQALAQRPTSVEQKQYKLTGEKDPPKQPFAQKESAGNWPQHAQHAHSKRPATPTSPLQRSFGREKASSVNHSTSGTLPSSASQPGHRYSHQNPPPAQAPIRCQSVAPSNPLIEHSRPNHTRSESLDRGRSSAREDARFVKKTPSPSVKSEKSPDKTKESYRLSADGQPNNLPPNPVSYYSYPFVERSGFPGVGSYPSLPPGYLIPQPVLPSQADWMRGAQHPPVSGKQSPPMKLVKERQSPTRCRAPSKEDVKPISLTSPFPSKDALAREGLISDSASERKLMTSPDPKPDLTSPPNARKSTSTSAVSSEIPTQMHHHTHHHIHGGVLLPPHFYSGPPVLGGPESVPGYSVPFQKRYTGTNKE